MLEMKYAQFVQLKYWDVSGFQKTLL